MDTTQFMTWKGHKQTCFITIDSKRLHILYSFTGVFQGKREK